MDVTPPEQQVGRGDPDSLVRPAFHGWHWAYRVPPKPVRQNVGRGGGAPGQGPEDEQVADKLGPDASGRRRPPTPSVEVNIDSIPMYSCATIWTRLTMHSTV